MLIKTRQTEIDEGMAQLSDVDRKAMKVYAQGNSYGGSPLFGALLARMVELKFAYAATGKLRSDVYKILMELP